MNAHDTGGFRDTRSGVRRLAGAIFLQMLPATLVTPAIRPLFAAQHGGHEGPMHAFMALNMLGGCLAAPWIGRLADGKLGARGLFVAMTLIDGALFAALAAPIPTAPVLTLRFLEGCLHVGAATVLLRQAAVLGKASGDGRVMGLAGGAIMAAIALGSAIGGLTLAIDVRGPFWLGGILLALVGAAAACPVLGAVFKHSLAQRAGTTPARFPRAFAVPVSAAFVERFSIGCIVVSFALFAHKAHGLSDAAVGSLFTLMLGPFALLTYPMARLSERVSRAGLLGAGGMAFAASLISLGYVSPAVLPGVMLAAGVACAMMFAPTLCYAATLAPPDQRGRGMAFVNAAGCLGMLVGPAAAGIACGVLRSASDPLQGYRTAFAIAGGSVLVWLAACTGWLGRQLRAEQPPAESHAVSLRT